MIKPFTVAADRRLSLLSGSLLALLLLAGCGRPVWHLSVRNQTDSDITEVAVETNDGLFHIFGTVTTGADKGYLDAQTQYPLPQSITVYWKTGGAFYSKDLPAADALPGQVPWIKVYVDFLPERTVRLSYQAPNREEPEQHTDILLQASDADQIPPPSWRLYK